MDNDRPVEILDVVIVLKRECAERFATTVETIKSCGLKVESTDPDNDVIEGTLPAEKLAEVRELPCVSYARVDFEYIAEPPRSGGTAESGGQQSN